MLILKLRLNQFPDSIYGDFIAKNMLSISVLLNSVNVQFYGGSLNVFDFVRVHLQQSHLM